MISNPTEGVKDSCFHTPQEGEKTPCVLPLSHGVFILDQLLEQLNPAVGSRLKLFLQAWKTLGAHRSILNLITEGYKLPLRRAQPCT